jgi:hypothetical protein
LEKTSQGSCQILTDLYPGHKPLIYLPILHILTANLAKAHCIQRDAIAYFLIGYLDRSFLELSPVGLLHIDWDQAKPAACETLAADFWSPIAFAGLR